MLVLVSLDQDWTPVFQLINLLLTDFTVVKNSNIVGLDDAAAYWSRGGWHEERSRTASVGFGASTAVDLRFTPARKADARTISLYNVGDLTGDGLPEMLIENVLDDTTAAPGVGRQFNLLISPITRDFSKTRLLAVLGSPEAGGSGGPDATLGQAWAFRTPPGPPLPPSSPAVRPPPTAPPPGGVGVAFQAAMVEGASYAFRTPDAGPIDPGLPITMVEVQRPLTRRSFPVKTYGDAALLTFDKGVSVCVCMCVGMYVGG